MHHNILFITADQLSFRAFPSAYAHTPNLNRIAAGAVSFNRCYTPCPMCQPARAAYWTGRYPHETTVISNGGAFRDEVTNPALVTVGDVFRAAGYETVHFGKKHDAGALRGFACAAEKTADVTGPAAFPYTRDTKADRYTADEAAAWLSKPKDKPFLAAVEFVNPHNICDWVGHNEGVHDNAAGTGDLPPLPENYDFGDIANRPRSMQYICCAHRRQTQTTGWTDDNFRAYVKAYCHYLEVFDRELGLVLDALEASGQADDTVILFTADHGDHMAARGMTTKHAALYEEVMRVPMLIKLPGGQARQVDAPTSLLDLFPTFCGIAGIEAPEGLRGLDLLGRHDGIGGWHDEGIVPYAADGSLAARDAVFGEWHTEWGYTVAPGRMAATRSWKYNRFINDGEELFDLVNDPFETKNLANDAAYAAQLADMRARLAAHIEATGDDFLTLSPSCMVRDENWAAHPVGYQNHTGPAAPDAV